MLSSFSSSITKLGGLSIVSLAKGHLHFSGFRLTQLNKSSDVISSKIIKNLEDAGFSVQLNHAIQLHQAKYYPTDPMYQMSQNRTMSQIRAPESWFLGPDARQAHASSLICVIDSGLDCNHPDLRDSCRVVNFNGMRGSVYDPSTGNLIAMQPQAGTAPQVSLYFIH